MVNRLKYIAYRFGAAAVRRLPLRIAYGIATAAGTAAAYLAGSRRRAVIMNLQVVLGPHTSAVIINRTVAHIFQSVGRYYVDLLSVPRLDVGDLRRSRVRVDGYEHLAEALGQGHGVLLVTAHYGCPEVSLQVAQAWGIEILVLTEPIEPPELSALFDGLRASHGHRFVTAGLSGGKEAIRTLRRGGAVLLAVDRDIQGHGVEVPYFGSPARMPVGAVELARRSGAPIVPAISHRLSNGGAVITLEAPVELLQTADHRSDTALNIARVLERFEPTIRADPGQWLVLESIWENQPVREASSQAKH